VVRFLAISTIWFCFLGGFSAFFATTVQAQGGPVITTNPDGSTVATFPGGGKIVYCPGVSVPPPAFMTTPVPVPSAGIAEGIQKKTAPGPAPPQLPPPELAPGPPLGVRQLPNGLVVSTRQLPNGYVVSTFIKAGKSWIVDYGCGTLKGWTMNGQPVWERGPVPTIVHAHEGDDSQVRKRPPCPGYQPQERTALPTTK
jgi:hypothetical protein